MPEDEIAQVPEQPTQMIGYDRDYPYPNAIAANIYAPIHPNDTAEMIAEKKKFYIQQMVQVLRQAYNIRHDPKLMADIRIYLRNEKDELTDILDEIA